MGLEKYSRQILFQPIGAEGQQKLQQSKVAIIGCGALGTAQANALARAGVGVLRIVDRDYVEESNLQRQMLFDEVDAAQNLPKAIAAQRKLKAINSDVVVDGYIRDLDSRNAEDTVRGSDVILDGTDNFETRYLINDVALKLGIPWIYGAVVGSYAATLTVVPASGSAPRLARHAPTPCLACVFPESPRGTLDTCDTVGVIGTAVAWVAAVQVTEALKILLGRYQELHGSLVTYDLWKNRFQQIKPQPDPACRACGERDFVHLRGGGAMPTTLCGRDAVQICPRESRNLNLATLKTRLEPLGRVRANEYLIRFIVDAYELTVFSDGRTIIKGTHDPAVARGLYARYVGS